MTKPARCSPKWPIISAPAIPHIWIIDPYKRTALEADQSGLRRASGLVLATPFVGEVDIAALFGDLDEPAAL